MMNKYVAQKNEFAGKPYESLPDQEKLNILNTKNGYLRPSHVQQISDLVNQKVAGGMSERDAAAWVSDAIEKKLQTTSLRTVATANEVQKFANYFDNAKAQSGVPAKFVANEMFNPSTGRSIKYAGLAGDVAPFSSSVSTARKMAVRYIQPLTDYMPPSFLRGIRNEGKELAVAKALFGQAPDQETQHLADSLFKMAKAMNSDLNGVNMRQLDEQSMWRRPFPRGDKVLKDMQGFNDYMQRPGIFDWSEAQKEFIGKYNDDASQKAILRDINNVVISKGAYQNEEASTVLSKLTFKHAEDWMDFNSKYGQGGMFNVLNHITENYAREYAWGKLTGGDYEAWRAGVLQHVGEVAPEEAAAFRDKLDARIAERKINFSGDIDGMVRYGGDILKDLTVYEHLGYSGLAALFHFPMVIVRSAQEGLSGLGAFVKGTKNVVSQAASVLGDKGFEEYAQRLSQAGVNSDRTLFRMNRAFDENIGNPVTRVFKQASASTSNASGLGNFMIAMRMATSDQIRQDIARELESGTKVADSAMTGLKHVGMTDNDMDFIRKNGYYQNNDYSKSVGELDLHKLWNSGAQGQTVATKIQHLMDNIGLAGAPHSNEAWHQQLNKMRNSGALGNTMASLVGPLTGYLSASWSEIWLPALMQPTVLGKIGWTTATMVAMQQLGCINTQVKRLQDLKDLLPWDSLELQAQGASRAGLMSQVMSLTADLGTNSRSDGNFLQRSLPILGSVGHVYTTVQDEVKALYSGKANTKRMGNFSKILADFTPSSLPLIPSLMDRFVASPVRSMIDPSAEAKHNAYRIQYEKQHHGRYIINPGQTTINTAP